MAKVGRGADQYTVRFSDGLRDRIKAVSEATGRSMNDLIVQALEEKYPVPVSEALIEDAVKILEKFMETSPAEFRATTERMLKRLKNSDRSLAEYQALVTLKMLAQIGAESISDYTLPTDP